MAELDVIRDGGRVKVTDGATVVAEYQVDLPIEPANTPKPFFHPLRTPGGVEITGFAPEDHVWHHGLAFAFPRAGGHNLWGGGTYLSPHEGYRDLDNQGSIRHAAWDDVSADADGVSISHDLRWLGHEEQPLLTEHRSWRLHRAADAVVIDLETTLTNASDAAIELATPGQRGRADGGYGGLFLRLGHDFGAESLLDGARPVEASGHASRTLVVHGRTGSGEAVTLGLAFLPGSDGEQRWLYRFEPFSAIGWAVAYDDGFDLPVGGTLHFAHRLALADGHVEPAVMQSLL